MVHDVLLESLKSEISFSLTDYSTLATKPTLPIYSWTGGSWIHAFLVAWSETLTAPSRIWTRQVNILKNRPNLWLREFRISDFDNKTSKDCKYWYTHFHKRRTLIFLATGTLPFSSWPFALLSKAQQISVIESDCSKILRQSSLSFDERQ